MTDFTRISGNKSHHYIIDLAQLGIKDIEEVGGKNASLGEMISNLSELGVDVPGGFATTAAAYREFLAANGLADRINNALSKLDINNVAALTETGKKIRSWILDTPFQPALETAIEESFSELEKQYGPEVSWAIRSSATAEDLPSASFAGQQETYLNVSGLNNVKRAIKKVFASLYTDRAITYRVHQGFEHSQVALSAGVQKMVRSDKAASGVVFTLDTESGFRDVVFITGSYGLGEMVVQGAVNPDEFYVHKPTLSTGRPAVLRRNLGTKAIKMIYAQRGNSPVKTVPVDESDRQVFCINDREVEKLAQMAVIIEQHYGRPMDIEWAKDSLDNNIYIVQARPETVQSQQGNVIDRFTLKETGRILAEGRSIGGRIGQGAAKIISDVDQMDRVEPGDVLVTDMTDPDWEPIMQRASAIVTNRGGRTCHAAIIAREMGVPAVVGCGDATKTIPDGHDITVSCAEGDTGFIYEGRLQFEHSRVVLDELPEIPVKIMMNVGNPDRAFDACQIPNSGVGLARLEFIINNMIGIHPKALMDMHLLTDEERQQIQKRSRAYGTPAEFYVNKLAEGIATIAAAFSPKPVILRLSDFKSNEYARLIGGQYFEPEEENPMLGFRGALRYLSTDFRPSFDLECRAIKQVRDLMGLTNIEVMVPFVRTLDEARRVIEVLSENGLKRGENGLRIIMMCELPSNALLAEQFLTHFDGFSIGSNDLTQLTLGMDRDSSLVAGGFDERNPAVLAMLKMAIEACQAQGKYVGICGQGPSDHPDLAQWLLDQGIDSISLNPDTVVGTWSYLAAKTS